MAESHARKIPSLIIRDSRSRGDFERRVDNFDEEPGGYVSKKAGTP
jgi:hypothetical protein